MINAEFKNAGLDESKAHTQVKIGFVCEKGTSDLNLFINMAKVNQVPVDEMKLVTKDGKQEVELVLDGNIKEAGMRQFLCQTAKESEGSRIIGRYARKLE